LDERFFINAQIRLGWTLREEKILTETDPESRQMLYISVACPEIEQLESKLLVERAALQAVSECRRS
jgi:hypothetical protein